MRPEEIIIAPVVTEKSNDELQLGKYTFEVNKKATKVEIAKAVEKLFEVKVLKVNTMTVKGKEKRVGYHTGKTSDWKKAIVTIETNPGEATYLAKGGKETKATKKFKDSIDEFIEVYKDDPDFQAHQDEDLCFHLEEVHHYYVKKDTNAEEGERLYIDAIAGYDDKIIFEYSYDCGFYIVY